MAGDPTNPDRMAVAYVEGEKKQVCGLGLSEDGGKSWKTKDLVGGGGVAYPPGYDQCFAPYAYPFGSRPQVAYGPSGRVYYVHILADGSAVPKRVLVMRSTDGGATFAPPQLVDASVKGNEFDAEPAVAVDQATGRVHVTWTRSCSTETPCPSEPVGILSASSGDGGLTFSSPRRVDPTQAVVERSYPAVGQDGTLYVSWLESTAWYPGVYLTNAYGLDATIEVASSKNQGQTFSAPVAVAGAGGGMCNLGSCDLPYDEMPRLQILATGPSAGQISMAWWDRLPDGRYRIFFSASKDGAQTWSQPRFFGVPPGGEGNDQHRPGVAVAPNGRIDISYYDLTPDLQQDVYSIYSCDGGTTFSTARKVTAATSDATIGPQASGASRRATRGTQQRRFTLFGEVGVLSSATSVSSAWTDTRRGTTAPNQPETNKQDVFFASLSAPSCDGQGPGPDTGQRPPPPPPPPSGGGPGPGGGGGPTPTPALGPGLRPGVAGSRCGDLTRPRSSVSKRSRLMATRIMLSGRTTDRECSPEGRVVRTKRKLARVEVSVGRPSGKRCLFLTAKGKLSVPRSCARPVWLRASTVSVDAKKSKTSWKLERAVKLPAGRYNVIVRGVDRDGNVELKKRRSNRAKLRAR